MSRDNVTIAMGTALASIISKPVILAEFNFPSGDVNMWSGLGDLIWYSKTWTGVGHIAGVSFPKESSDNTISGATFSLDAVSSAWVSESLNLDSQYSKGTLWIGGRNDLGNIIDSPIKIFIGQVSLMPTSIGRDVCTINLTLERKVYDRRPDGILYDNESQQRKFPNDVGLKEIPSLYQKSISWGVPTASVGSINNSGGLSGSGGSSGGNSTNPRNTNRGGRGR